MIDAREGYYDAAATLSSGGLLPDCVPYGANGTSQGSIPAPAGSTSARRRSPSRYEVLNDFVDVSMRLVSTTAQASWLVLYRDVKRDGVACMAHSQIAERIGKTRRTVVRALKELENARLVTVVRRGGLNQGSSAYRVHGKPSKRR